MQVLETAANEGDIEAISNLAVLYLYDDNIEAGISFLEVGSEFLYLPRLYNLGIVYIEGKYVKKSKVKAMNAFEKVVKYGPLSIYSRIGYKLTRKQEYKGAFWAFAIASRLGYIESMQSLAYFLKSNLGPYPCKENYISCIGKYYVNMLQLGVTQAFSELGKLAFKKTSEKGVHNYTEAYKMFKSAKYTGEVMYYLAYMSENGLGTEKNLTFALETYWKIIEKVNSKELTEEHYFPAALSLLKIKTLHFFNSILSYLN